VIVLDASAVLAVAHREPGAAKVLAKQSDLMVISSVNYAEALQKVVQHGGMAEDVLRILRLLNVDIVDFTRLGAWVAAELWRKGHGLSLGDRACLALTRETDGVAYTTDRAWKAVGEEFGIAVRLLR
jgi:PIN domain nuclease of toxin-antitoxin system